jgi:hypothetical protein
MNIAEIIAPLIVVASVGYWCAKTQWLSKNQLDGLSKFTFTLIIPAFLFYKMATATVASDLTVGFFLAFYLPVLGCYFIAWLLNKYFNDRYRLNNAASAVFALASSYSNTVIVGLPILLMLYGEQAMVLIFAIVTFHSALLFTLTSLFNHEKVTGSWLNSLLKTFNNPLLLSIFAGAVFNALSITLPTVINESLQLLAKPAITLALFILGASLAFYSLKTTLKFVSIAAIIKLILLPTSVYIIASQLFTLPLIQLNILVILSACPTGVNAYLVAKNFTYHEKTVASTVVVTTLLATVTIPLWLWFLSVN